MNELQIIERDGKLLVDSREVAEMVEKRHDHLVRDIKGYMKVLSGSPKMGNENFFIESSYENRGKHYPHYLLTKKGCDMVANKMTGEKGILFTATYVTKFDEMERSLKPEFPKSLPEALRMAADLAEKNQQLVSTVTEYEPKVRYVDKILQTKNTVTTTQIAKDYGMSAKALNKILHEKSIQFKQSGQWLLYAKYQDKGYTKSSTVDIYHINGGHSVKMNTKWTQKGRLFIHQILEERGIYAVSDREESSQKK